MNAAVSESPAWSRRRWWGIVIAVVVVQTGFIFWMGNEPPVAPRTTANEPQVVLAPGFAGDLADLYNPTLFATASRRGFSGEAWLKTPPLAYQPIEWTEPPRFLDLSTNDLGTLIGRLLQSNTPAPLQIASKAEPEINFAALPPITTSLPTQSFLRIEGALAGRKLLSDFALPSRPGSDILTNSVVRVLVAADGWTQSAVLVNSSGYESADQRAANEFALTLARSARFESLRGRGPERLAKPVPEVSWGTLVFCWHTVPLPATNAPVKGS